MSRSETEHTTIQKLELHEKLVSAAHARSIVTMLSIPASLFIGVLILGESASEGVTPFVLLFGVPGLVAWLVTMLHCRQSVRCPHCGSSLWGCGTGNFKPRRMKVRDNARECPGCRTPIG